MAALQAQMAVAGAMRPQGMPMRRLVAPVEEEDHSSALQEVVAQHHAICSENNAMTTSSKMVTDAHVNW